MKKIKLLVLLSVLVSSTMFSDIKLDLSKLQNTTIERGKRGNVIININTPNGKGISVNDFENFQSKNGVVFNNSGQRMNISQLEGIINGNPNITGDQAKLILNRVNGTNRAEIEGAMEAVGRNKVDMIFSSPNGIYIDGAKFIGFKDVTFTTAPVNLDEDGNIQTLTIDKGNIEVGRKGLDASKLEQLALLSKQISIDGEVRGKNIDLIAGDFDYDLDNKYYRKIENYFNGAGYISSSEFGSIYGEQIQILAIDGNVGIKGDIISNKDLYIKGVYESTTEGKIIISRNLYINIEGAYISNGDIEVDGTAYINVGKAALMGNLLVNEYLILNGYITNSGTIISGGMSSPEFYNYGLVYVNDFFKSSDLYNEGQIISGEIGSQLIYNKGEIHSAKIYSGTLKNVGIIEDKNLFIEANHLSNDGILSAQENLEVRSYKIHNEGELNAKNLKLIFKDFSSQGGKITADKISFENYPE